MIPFFIAMKAKCAVTRPQSRTVWLLLILMTLTNVILIETQGNFNMNFGSSYPSYGQGFGPGLENYKFYPNEYGQQPTGDPQPPKQVPLPLPSPSPLPLQSPSLQPQAPTRQPGPQLVPDYDEDLQGYLLPIPMPMPMPIMMPQPIAQPVPMPPSSPPAPAPPPTIIQMPPPPPPPPAPAPASLTPPTVPATAAPSVVAPIILPISSAAPPAAPSPAVDNLPQPGSQAPASPHAAPITPLWPSTRPPFPAEGMRPNQPSYGALPSPYPGLPPLIPLPQGHRYRQQPFRVQPSSPHSSSEAPGSGGGLVPTADAAAGPLSQLLTPGKDGCPNPITILPTCPSASGFPMTPSPKLMYDLRPSLNGTASTPFFVLPIKDQHNTTTKNADPSGCLRLDAFKHGALVIPLNKTQASYIPIDGPLILNALKGDDNTPFLGSGFVKIPARQDIHDLMKEALKKSGDDACLKKLVLDRPSPTIPPDSCQSDVDNVSDYLKARPISASSHLDLPPSEPSLNIPKNNAFNTP